jgi:hypothetical protein
MVTMGWFSIFWVSQTSQFCHINFLSIFPIGRPGSLVVASVAHSVSTQLGPRWKLRILLLFL